MITDGGRLNMWGVINGPDPASLNTTREAQFFIVVSHAKIPSLALLAMNLAAVLTTSQGSSHHIRSFAQL